MTPIYQLRIDLMGAKPPIWRRILISSSDTLYNLHCAIQNSMGWTNSHLHSFEKGRTFYGMKDVDDDFETLDEKKFTIAQLLGFEGDTLFYTYDFGDSWDHKIKLEKIIAEKIDGPLPEYIKGKNACPPEDVGGLWGYYNMLEILEDPNHPEYEETLEWLGGSFDPKYIDLKKINYYLSTGCIDHW